MKTQQQIQHLLKAISYLNYAKYQVKLAFGDTCAGELTTNDINGLIEDLDSDIEYFNTQISQG